VLVNGLDRHLDAAHALLRRFRFVPDARLDDLMASYATDGGGVGPHADSYDVFLLQAHGQRRWRVAPPDDGGLVPGAPVKLLARFAPTQEWLLGPGDMLYVPPGWGHEGTAVGESITLSIGFRAPSRHEFLSAFLAASADSPGGSDPRFSDRGRVASTQPGALPTDLVTQLQGWARDWRPRRSDIERFIGCYLTEPAADVWFEGSDRMQTASQFTTQARRLGVVLDRRTRMAWRGTQVFINGEPCDAAPAERAPLRALSNDRALSAARLRTVLENPELAHRLHVWSRDGWLHLGTAQATGR
jgi:50S ribosomal protein L16 3-hydroxylase